MASSSKKKCRHYNDEYLQYGFIENSKDPKLPYCLSCQASLSNEAMKPSRLSDHQARKHPENVGKPMEYFEKLKLQFQKRNTVALLFQKQTKINDGGLIASYKIAEIIAKTGSAHMVGEKVIIPAVKAVISDVMNQDPSPVIKSLPLSNDSIRRRIDEMSNNIENILFQKLKTTAFSIQIDESTVVDNKALLMGYVRYFDDHCSLKEDLLFVKLLETDTTGTSIFMAVKSFFEEKSIPFENIVSCATDGAMSMVGRHKGFIAHLKKLCPEILVVHCVLHRHQLVAKTISPDLNQALNIVIQTINKIKSNSKFDRLFRKFCVDFDEQYVRLLLHTDVRWLSKGNCLERFVNLFDTIIAFLQAEGHSDLANEIQTQKKNICYLSWIFRKLNEVSLSLQGKLITLIDCKRVMRAFVEKLDLFRCNLQRKQFHNMPDLAELDLCQNDINIFCAHLSALKNDYEIRFADLFAFKIHPWMIDPFRCDPQTVNENVQEEVIELKNHDVLEMSFKAETFNAFWQSSTVKALYPKLWSHISKVFLCFPTSYLVEAGFSAVNHLLRKERNRLDVVSRGDIRLCLSDIQPDIKLLAEGHQAQGSH